MTTMSAEFDRQVSTLLQKGYPKAAGLTEEEFLQKVAPLKSLLKDAILPKPDLVAGILPFVIVITNHLISSEKMMELVEKDGKQGVTILRPHTSENFHTIESVDLPPTSAYLLINIDRGRDTINLPPNQALPLIQQAHRSPLTIDEGIALVTQYPDFLIKNNCFSLLASRTGKDQRVPAIWINAKKQPNLGWCWDGNPHTWLGSASAASRLYP
jgi:hypothetical protein